MEGGGGVQEERVGRVRLVEEGVGGQSEVGQVGRQGGVGCLRQASGKAPFLENLSITQTFIVLVTKMPDVPRSPARFLRCLTMWTLRMFGCNLELGASEPHSSQLFEARKFRSIKGPVTPRVIPCLIGIKCLNPNNDGTTGDGALDLI